MKHMYSGPLLQLDQQIVFWFAGRSVGTLYFMPGASESSPLQDTACRFRYSYPRPQARIGFHEHSPSLQSHYR